MNDDKEKLLDFFLDFYGLEIQDVGRKYYIIKKGDQFSRVVFVHDELNLKDDDIFFSFNDLDDIIEAFKQATEIEFFIYVNNEKDDRELANIREIIPKKTISNIFMGCKSLEEALITKDMMCVEV